MNRITLWVLLSVLSAVQVVQAGESTMIPIKGEINASGEVDLIIRVYDQPEGGRLLYQLTKMVTVEDQIFDVEIYVPSELLSANPQFFVGFASASAPEDEIGERMQFTQVRDMSEDDLDNVDDEMMGNQVAEEQAIDEELGDPGLAAEIAEEKMALVDTEAISLRHHAPCGTVPPDNDSTQTSDAASPNAANQRSGSSTDCPILGVLQPSDDANYFCFTAANDGSTWTYLQNLRTRVRGWTRDDLLRDRGSFVHCNF